MSSSSLRPMTSIVMVQATSLTPCSWALAMSSSSDMAFCSFMTFFIIGAPRPAKFILDRPSLPGPRGMILPNMTCRVDFFSFTWTFSGLRRALRPQKVKNIVTSSPMAAAPLAMMNAAIILSRSPLKTMIVFLVVSIPAPPVLLGRGSLGSASGRVGLAQVLRDVPEAHRVAGRAAQVHEAHRTHGDGVGRRGAQLRDALLGVGGRLGRVERLDGAAAAPRLATRVLRVADGDAGGRQQLARLVDDALVAGEDARIVHDDFAGEDLGDMAVRPEPLVGQHLEVAAHFDVVALQHLGVDAAQHRRGVWIDGDDRLHAALLEDRVDALRVLGEHFVGAQVVGEGTRVQVFLV